MPSWVKIHFCVGLFYPILGLVGVFNRPGVAGAVLFLQQKSDNFQQTFTTAVVNVFF